MNPAYHIYEQIDKYLKNEMSEQELAEFDSKISADEELKELVNAQNIANQTIIDNEMINLKQRMIRDFNEAENNSTNWTKIIGILSLIIITATYTYIKLSDSKKHPTINNKASVTSKEYSNPIQEPSKTSTPIKNDKPSSGIKPSLKNESSSNDNLPEESLVSSSTNLTKQQEPELAHKISTIEGPTTTEQKVEIDCKSVKINADAKVYYTNGEATIIIDKLSIKGGTVPYSYALDDNHFSSNTNFSSLNDGIYHIKIKDKHNCITELPTVIVKMPAKEIDEVFAPERGEKWKFPIKKESTGNISIFNKAGSVVFHASFSGGYPEEWDGNSNSGVELESGNYYFVIQYSDSEILKGHISIIK